MGTVDALEHGAAIEHLLADPGLPRGGPPAPPEWLRRSWQRSAERHRLEPARPQRRFVVTQGELREAAGQAERLRRVAWPHLQQLHHQVAAARHCVLLSDADGVVLQLQAQGELAQVLSGAGVRAGSVWREDFEGTCGIGTALVERMPVLVHRDQHFRLANVAMSCAAVPVFDADDRLLGVLDASTLGVGQPRDGARALVFELVRQSAIAIENDFIAAEFGDSHWRLLLGTQSHHHAPAQQMLLCIDDAGRVQAANRLARQTLLSGRRAHPPIEEIFDTGADALFAAARAAPGIALPLHTLAGATRLWCTPKAPRRRAASRASAVVPEDALAMLGAGDAAVRRAADIARRVADKRLPVLIEGETGTGKEVFARALHASSARRDKPFVALNCAAIPATLIEGELYGHVAGAFTGARARGAKGKLLQSSGGTLFLDEIGDMPLELQSRLLRVLAEQEVVPLGGDAPVRVELHVVCASHRDLTALVRQGLFREDLYYRLSGATLRLPPLRERSDLGALIDRVLREECEALGRGLPRLDPAARGALQACRWPGNIRQLRHVLRFACAVSDGDVLDREALPAALSLDVRGAASETADEPLAERMRRALLECDGRVDAAAARLAMPRSTFYRKMRAFGLGAPHATDPHG